MQKDIHFYLTYTIARKVGISGPKAERIAWANQYTDELTDAQLHGIQTQSGVFDNWADRQVQFSVLVPFHFIPGDDKAQPWKTTPDSKRANKLADAAVKLGDTLRLGISLHTLQDTFSHQGFSGWQEKLNACYPWYYVKSSIPNVGHAEMMVTPDVVHYVWTDPRNGDRIDNRIRAMAAAKATYDRLLQFAGVEEEVDAWAKLKDSLSPLFQDTDYDKRVTKLCKMAGQNSKFGFEEVNKKLERTQKANFIKAANTHLADAMQLIGDLPRK